ncbi:hypothetical protein SAMN05421505_102306 [Sinosporangium album]|uniref:Uncharacterized protein n=1 Tax=Sinosporangium album TaxID=504805 RepID=A0A1G7SJB5_9ACTN|nr:hypothetical protein [Sinosporangium album]SDG22330.1 hypothetical protein SAMN05421505_102306 [Sinosporangium album]
MDVTFAIVDEKVASLESIGVEEGCSSSSSSSSLDISGIDFE